MPISLMGLSCGQEKARPKGETQGILRLLQSQTMQEFRISGDMVASYKSLGHSVDFIQGYKPCAQSDCGPGSGGSTEHQARRPASVPSVDLQWPQFPHHL